MTHEQIEKDNMYKKVLIFLLDPRNAALWAVFPRLAREISNFVTLNGTLAAHIQQHQTDTSGVTKLKKGAFATMVGLVVRASMKAYVWAVDTGNEKLADLFDVPASEFTRIPESQAFARLKNVRDALAANVGSMASVELGEADIAAINAAVSVYEATIGTTGAAKVHKEAGTQGIEQVMSPIDKSLGLIDNLLVSHYQDSHPDVVQEYWLSRSIDKLPRHHSGVALHATDALTGDDLEGATLTVGDKTSASDINGLAEIIKVKAGTYNVTIALEGYVTQTVKVVIERGKVTSLAVKLVRC